MTNRSEINNILLNGTWKYLKDSGGEYLIEDIQKIFRSPGIKDEMNIPINWELAELHNHHGTVWFIKEFEFTGTKNDLKILQFLGVDYFADVWLNWQYIGSHEGYFQPFFFNINESLSDGKNILIVKVNSPFETPGEAWPLRKKLIKGIFNHHDCRPGGWSMEQGQDKNTGGIWNDVVINCGFPIYLENVKITSTLNSEDGSAVLLIDVNYFSSFKFPESTEINLLIESPSQKKIKEKFVINFSPGSGQFSHVVKITKPELWWSRDLGTPNLYKIKINSEIFEEKLITTGIREIRLDDEQQFYLNNKKLFLRGTNIIPEQFLSQLNSDKIKKIVELIQDANINIVRVHAHVNRKELYEAFDEAGIMLWQDFSLQWTYDTSAGFAANAVKQLKEMVSHLYNHPSIVFWCCHNEPGEQIHTLDQLLRQAVLQEDTTRIIRTASNYEEHPYDGWYWGTKDHFAAAPMGPLVTEFGAQALPQKKSLNKFLKKDDLFPPNWKAWEYHNFQIDTTFNIAKIEMGKSIDDFITNSQSYQSGLLQTAIDFYRRKKFTGITGIFQFMFIDCWPSITWSVVDYFHQTKPGYEALKRAYQPVYVSINLRQDQYFPGKKLLIDIYVINDLYEEYQNASINFFLDEKKFNSLEKINVEKNSVLFISYEKIKFMLPDSIKPGRHKIKTEMISNNKQKISDNSFEFSVVKHLM
jgi:beta-mannosidase